MLKIAYLFLLFSLNLGISRAFGPRKLFTLEVDANLVSVNVVEGTRLVLSGNYYVGVIENIQWKYTQPNRMKIDVVNTDIPDPRYVDKLPYGTLKTKGLLYYIASWATNDTDGHIAIMRTNKDGYGEYRNVDIGSGWSYDRAIWVDMNRDGLKDCLTARYRDGVGQLLFFTQPNGQGVWNQKIINEGEADGNFKTIQHYKRNYIVVAANQFSSLSVFWTTDPKGKWTDEKKLRKTVVDNYGKYYDVQHVDLNNDKRKDILTTTIKVSDARGQVLGYDLPDDLRYGKWKRKVLATGFDSAYSPGKAIAYFPNKFRQKSERPSIFLTGGSSGKLYILSPKPKTKGWTYVKTYMQVATVGAVGIPWIGDLNADSYPEIFVPQGNKLHIYAYDYVTSAADPPASALLDDESEGPPKKKKPLKNRPPYYRPSISNAPVFQGSEGGKKVPEKPSEKPTATEKPEIEKEETKKENEKSTETSDAKQKPVQTNNYQSNPNKPVNLFNGQQTVVAKPYSQMQNGQIVYQVDTSSSEGFNQQPFIVVNQKPVNPNPFVPNQVPQTNTSNSQAVQPNSPYQIIPQQPTYVQPQPIYMPNPFLNNPFINNPFNPMLQPQMVQQPFWVAPPSTNLITPKTTKSTTKPTESTLETTAKQEETTNFVDAIDYRVVKEGPEYLKLTNAVYETHEIAVVSCEAMKRKLCTLKELQYALHIEKIIPDTVWGWYDQEGRAAKLESCVPGEVRFAGLECFNGDVIHTPIRKSNAFKSFCCATVNGALLTTDKYMTHDEAYVGCAKQNHHLCNYDEMLDVYLDSTYKDMTWGWFEEKDKMIRMSKQCNENDEPWQGYKCHEGLFETSPVRSRVEESAYCCPNKSTKLDFSFFSLLSFILFTVSWSL